MRYGKRFPGGWFQEEFWVLGAREAPRGGPLQEGWALLGTLFRLDRLTLAHHGR